MDKGEKLNKKVWKLFSNAGFKTKPSDSDPKEEIIQLKGKKERTVDLCAWDDELKIKIIGENKAGGELKTTFTGLVHDYDELKKNSKADGVLFVLTEKELSDDEKDYAIQHKMTVWGKEELDYYTALVDTIGEYAKYEIVHSLGINSKEEKDIHQILAIKFEQPITNSGKELFVFITTPEFLLKTCVVLRKAQGNKLAYQRILNKKRLIPIKNFVTQPEAILPTNIVVHLNDDVEYEQLDVPTKNNGRRVSISREEDSKLVLLKIPKKFASLELIDGQHRLFGFIKAEPATRKTFNLAVLGILNIDSDQRTRTFVAINDKAKKVDPNLVAFLKYNSNEDICQNDGELMAIKIVYELNRTAPFKNKIKLLDAGTQIITLKGFAGYDLKGLIGVKGLLRQYYTNNSSEYVKVLRMYFSRLKSTFPDEWEDPTKFIIFTNKGISAFLKLLRSILKTEKNQINDETIRKYLNALKKNFKSWEVGTLKKSYVGSQGWKEFHRDLIKAIKKEFKKFKE